MRIPLTGGAYQAKSLIASAQECLNLYPERNPEDAPAPFSYYTRAGLTFLNNDPTNIDSGRGIYVTRNGQTLFCVIGAKLYQLNSLTSGLSLVGTMTEGHTPVSMIDNGLCLVVVDGSANGYVVDLTTGTFPFGAITDPSFYGANRVDYADTFFTFNQPGTQNLYISLSNATFGMMHGQPLQASQPQGAGQITAPGSGYTAGTYTGVSLTYVTAPTRSNPGTGATATVTVAGGSVTSVVVDATGANYQVADQLTVAAASIGGTGSGFVWTTLGGAFDPLYIAAKTGAADPLVAQIANHREIWLIGQRTTEVWYNSGASDFPYAAMPGVFIEHGCAALYSVAKYDLSVFWLSQDDQGNGIVIQGENYQAKRISTHAMEAEFGTYTTISDAVAYVYQQGGHVFYVLNFPTADKTWVYDIASGLWHREAWMDATGLQHRVRGQGAAFAFNANVTIDWQTGSLFKIDPTVDTDAAATGNPQSIPWKRSFPHLMADGKRAIFSRFIADVDTYGADKAIGLHWSDTRGHTFGAPVYRSYGIAQGSRSLVFPRTGIGRDRVFELFGMGRVALNGAFVEVQPLAS